MLGFQGVVYILMYLKNGDMKRCLLPSILSKRKKTNLIQRSVMKQPQATTKNIENTKKPHYLGKLEEWTTYDLAPSPCNSH